MTENEAQWIGGAIYNDVYGASPFITNCTIAYNHDDEVGFGPTIGGIACDGSSETIIENTIVWGNNGAQIGGYSSVEYSDVEGGFPGVGNISTEPMFVNDVLPPYDYHLTEDSGCIDVGDDAVGPGYDIESNPRVDVDGIGTSGVITDVGAYEYHPL